MAFTTTTLSVAVVATDTAIVVASASGFAAGSYLRVNGEFMRVTQSYVSGTTIPVLRGVEGTPTLAHAITSNVTVGLASDFATGVPQATIAYPMGRLREMRSYTAAGALTLPTPGNDMLAIINGTVACAMTLANPTKDQDGDILIVLGNGKAAHTVTYTAGLGNGGSGLDVGTFDTNAQCSMQLIAANGIWVPLPSPLSGTLTGCDVAIA